MTTVISTGLAVFIMVAGTILSTIAIWFMSWAVRRWKRIDNLHILYWKKLDSTIGALRTINGTGKMFGDVYDKLLEESIKDLKFINKQ